MPKAGKVDLRNFSPDVGDAKDVDQTAMLKPNGKEQNQSEKNTVGKEHIVSHPSFGKLGAVQGR